MNNVKSWKKNLKKTGALALATLVMCGSASFVHAEEAITLNGGGNEHAVYGYQTDESNGYAANITWGDMIFVYDNGTYNPETGKLEATPGLKYVEPSLPEADTDRLVLDVYNLTTQYIESKDESCPLYIDNNSYQKYYQDYAYWKYENGNFTTEADNYDEYNATGESVDIENESYVVYSCTRYKRDEETGEETNVVEEEANAVSRECYVNVEDETDVRYDTHLLAAMGDYRDIREVATSGHWYGFNGVNNAVTVQNLSTAAVKLGATTAVSDNVGSLQFTLYSDTSNFGLSETGYLVDHKVGEETWFHGNEASGVLVAPTFKEDGTFETEGGTVSLYLNISGKPSEDVILQSEKNNGTDATVLGTITLNFSTSDDTALLLRGNPTTGQPSEGEEDGGE